MLGINDFWLFIISGIMLNIIPGPDSLYIIGRSASQGFKAGSIAAFGIGSGTFIHILAAAFGLSAILTASSMAFSIVKYIGAIYLIYMAYTMIMNKGDNDGDDPYSRACPLIVFSENNTSKNGVFVCFSLKITEKHLNKRSIFVRF